MVRTAAPPELLPYTTQDVPKLPFVATRDVHTTVTRPTLQGTPTQRSLVLHYRGRLHNGHSSYTTGDAYTTVTLPTLQGTPTQLSLVLYYRGRLHNCHSSYTTGDAYTTVTRPILQGTPTQLSLVLYYRGHLHNHQASESHTTQESCGWEEALLVTLAPPFLPP